MSLSKSGPESGLSQSKPGPESGLSPSSASDRPPFGRTVPGNAWDALDGVPLEPRTVSVIVPHYRQQAQLDRTLLALARQTYPAELVEVIVADDGSPTPPVVPPGVTVVRQADEGFRLSAARNLGVRAAHGELLCFLDADTVPEPDYLERLLRLPSLLPEAVVVGRRRHADLSGLATATPVELAAPERELPEPQWLRDAYRASRNLLDADERSYRFVIGAVTACSRWFFDQVGGYDEGFTAYGGEDWEWAARAWCAGAVLAHVPDAVAWHDGPEWAGRGATDAERRRAKNAETLHLAEAIAVPGSAPRAVLGSRTDVRVHLESAISPAAALVCVDSVLAVLPQARVVVPVEVAAPFAHDPRVLVEGGLARVEVRLARAVRVNEATELLDAVRGVGTGDLGEVVLSVGGEPLVAVRSSRAELRRHRWGADAPWRTEHREAPGLLPIDDEPELAAYLGGWG